MTGTVSRSRIVAAPIGRVWEAIADAHEFATWFGGTLDGPFEIGREVTGREEAEDIPIRMRIVAMEPPDRLVFDWPAFHERRMLDHLPWTRVEFRLTEVPEGTRVEVTETGFDRLPPEVRATVVRQHGEGWAAQLGSLGRHLGG